MRENKNKYHHIICLYSICKNSTGTSSELRKALDTERHKLCGDPAEEGSGTADPTVQVTKYYD